ncbi:MAG: tyrosine-type recombinase/integrase [Chloroflexi bacterium]|nr:tyrosine-type recombinase/integrase [Chloroflexota bacterium]MDA8187563.1 tyrosine-type recombinase/integrase [Dehalococcoidales bacterium]
MRKDDIPLERLIEHFRLFNRTENKSPRTVEWYDENLQLFLHWLQRCGKSTLLGDLDIHIVREFIINQQDRTIKHENHPFAPPTPGGFSSHTIQSRVRALRSFFHWLKREGYAETHILEDLKVPKVQKNLVEILSEEEIRAILGAIDRNTANGARNYAIVWIFLDTGLRCSELTNLKYEDTHIEEGYLRVLGKGNKERVVPVGANGQRIILRYRDHFRPQPNGAAINNFFLSLDGQPLTVNSVEQILGRLGKRAGVKRLHPHLLRHTFATRYLINGGDVFTLQRILGHTTLAMVNQYVQLASSHVVIQHRKFSPMDALGLRHRERNTTRVSKSKESVSKTRKATPAAI